MAHHRRKEKRTPRRPVQERRGILQIGGLFGLCMALAISTVLYTMVSKTHLWSGRSALTSALRASTLSQKINGVRGQILDRTGQVIAQQVAAYDLFANFDTRTEEEIESDNAIIEAQRDKVLKEAEETGRTGQVTAKLEADDAAAVDSYVEDPEAFVKALADVLGDQIDADDMLSRVKKGLKDGKSQISLGPGTSRVSSEVKERLEAMKIPGLSFTQDVSREYISTPFSSTLLGFAAYDDQADNIVGKMGLEQTMDAYLGGKNGLLQYEATSIDLVLPGSEELLAESSNGNNVKLTIDATLQQTVEEQMQKTMTDNNATDAWCLVMDPETGKVLTWASYPSFDQNLHNDIPSYTDYIAQHPMEPGSVVKPLIYSMAIDSGVYPWNAYYRAGSFAYVSDTLSGQITRLSDGSAGEAVINDALGTDYGTLTFADGLAHSSNIAICELLANYLNKEKVQDYYEAYDLFGKTGMAFVSEVAGTQNTTQAHDYLSTGFGQASSMTALSLCQAYTAIFNDGVMMTPYVVDSILDSDTGQTIQKFQPTIASVPISSAAASSVRDLMKHVMDPGMTGERFAIDGVSMALKTGTGEIYNEETGTYDTTNYTSSVIAAAPADDPKVMVYWGMQSSNYLEYSAEPFQEIMKAALKTCNVNTGTDQSVTEEYQEWNSWTMPSLLSHSLSFAEGQMEDKQVNTIIIGDGDTVISQFPTAGTTINSNDNVMLLTNGSAREMPDMIGWTRKDLTAFWQLTGQVISSNGMGRTVWQSIPAGTPIDNETMIEVRLESS